MNAEHAIWFRTLSTNWKHQSICFGQFLKLALGQFRRGGHRSISRFPFCAVTRWSISLLFGTLQFSTYGYFGFFSEVETNLCYFFELVSSKKMFFTSCNKLSYTMERSVRMHSKLKAGENPKPVINLIRNKGYGSKTHYCTGTGDPSWPSISV